MRPLRKGTLTWNSPPPTAPATGTIRIRSRQPETHRAVANRTTAASSGDAEAHVVAKIVRRPSPRALIAIQRSFLSRFGKVVLSQLTLQSVRWFVARKSATRCRCHRRRPQVRPSRVQRRLRPVNLLDADAVQAKATRVRRRMRPHRRRSSSRHRMASSRAAADAVVQASRVRASCPPR